jgi:hypothetical protein
LIVSGVAATLVSPADTSFGTHTVNTGRLITRNPLDTSSALTGHGAESHVCGAPVIQWALEKICDHEGIFSPNRFHRRGCHPSRAIPP